MGERVPGSIGSSAYPSRVLKGLKMGGHLGASRSFARGLEVVRIDAKRNLLFVKGAVPGYNGSFVIIKKCPDWVTSRKKQTFKAQAAAQAS